MNEIKMAVAAVGTFLSYFFGGFDSIFIALVIFLMIDYMTGVLAAFGTKTLNSSIGLQGIIKKVMQLFLVGVASILDGITGLPDPYVRTAVIYFLLANEGISILENVARAGVPVPGFLLNVLQQIRDREVKRP